MTFSQFGPTGRLAKLTKADDTTIDIPRGLWVGSAGTANMVDEQGNVLADFPLKEGYNPIRISQLETGGTADDIWGMY